MVGLLLAGFAAAQTTITIWTHHDLDVRFGDVDTVLFGPFEEANPDIDVEWRRVGGNYDDQIIVALAAGVAPDIFVVDGINVPAWAEQGFIRSIPESVIPWDVRTDYWPPTLEEMEWEGKLYALGLETNSHVLFYNAVHFEEAGVQPPQYWEDIPDLARRFTVDLDGDGSFDRWTLEMTQGYGEYGMWILSPWIWQNGGDILRDGKIVVDQAEAVDAVQFLGDLAHQYDAVPLPGQQKFSFFEGGASMNIAGPFLFGPLDASGMAWGAAPTPYPRNGQRVSGVGGWHWAVNANTQHPDEAYRVMQYLASQPFVELIASSYGTPVRRSVALDNPQYQSGPWQVAFDQMQHGKARPRTPKYPDLTRIMQAAFVSVIVDGVPARLALENAARELRALGIGE